MVLTLLVSINLLISIVVLYLTLGSNRIKVPSLPNPAQQNQDGGNPPQTQPQQMKSSLMELPLLEADSLRSYAAEKSEDNSESGRVSRSSSHGSMFVGGKTDRAGLDQKAGLSQRMVPSLRDSPHGNFLGVPEHSEMGEHPDSSRGSNFAKSEDNSTGSVSEDRANFVE